MFTALSDHTSVVPGPHPTISRNLEWWYKDKLFHLKTPDDIRTYALWVSCPLNGSCWLAATNLTILSHLISYYLLSTCGGRRNEATEFSEGGNTLEMVCHMACLNSLHCAVSAKLWWRWNPIRCTNLGDYCAWADFDLHAFPSIHPHPKFGLLFTFANLNWVPGSNVYSRTLSLNESHIGTGHIRH